MPEKELKKILPITEEAKELASRPENLEFARKVSLKLSRRLRMPIDDIESSAFYGLCEAAQKFDPTIGDNFHGFAYNFMLHRVMDFARKWSWGSRNRKYHPSSIDGTFAFDSKGKIFDNAYELVVCDKDFLEVSHWLHLVEFLASKLSKRNSEIFIMLYLYPETNTLKKVGEKIGYCESNVSLLHKKSIYFLKKYLKSVGINSPADL